MSTFYDDAEFAALKVVRIAASEEENEPRSAEICAVADDMFERHGDTGLKGLVVALARQYSAALIVVANHRGETVDSVIDGLEHHKLEQVTDDLDD